MNIYWLNSLLRSSLLTISYVHSTLHARTQVGDDNKCKRYFPSHHRKFEFHLICYFPCFCFSFSWWDFWHTWKDDESRKKNISNEIKIIRFCEYVSCLFQWGMVTHSSHDSRYCKREHAFIIHTKDDIDLHDKKLIVFHTIFSFPRWLRYSHSFILEKANNKVYSKSHGDIHKHVNERNVKKYKTLVNEMRCLVKSLKPNSSDVFCVCEIEKDQNQINKIVARIFSFVVVKQTNSV